jgi:hypothetical protein
VVTVYAGGSAALSFTKLQLAAARAVEKGLDSKLLALVNPRAWANMLSDQAALRMYDSSYSKQLKLKTELRAFNSTHKTVKSKLNLLSTLKKAMLIS